MKNIVQPYPYKIINIRKETDNEYTFRIESDIKPEHGQFVQISVPMIGECPISVSGRGEGWLEFTIRKVGKVTDCFFSKKAGDTLFLRGPYGKGWPVDQIAGRHLFIIAGGTGVSPVRSLINHCADNKGFVKSLNMILGFKDFESVLFKTELNNWEGSFTAWFCLDNEEHKGFHRGFVTEYISELVIPEPDDDYSVMVVGPPLMMKYTGIELLKNGFDENKIWMSFERKMSCAVGKCGHCRIDEVYVCLDGPVFPYTVARDLVD